VPVPVQALNQAFVHGIDYAPVAFEADRALDPALSFSPFSAPLSENGEDVSRIAPG
jgi:hypothetical protein